jgi:hypothetical protein
MLMKAKAKPKTKAPRRPTMPRTSDQMKQWSALLGNELTGWPHVKTKPMFGLLGFYRKKDIFAALPVTRAIGAPNSVIFKIEELPPEFVKRRDSDPRVSTGTKMRAKGWHAFEVNSQADLKDVLWWLNQAYELAK